MKAVQKMVGARPHQVDIGTQNNAPIPLLLCELGLVDSRLAKGLEACIDLQQEDIKRVGVVDRVWVHLPFSALSKN